MLSRCQLADKHADVFWIIKPTVNKINLLRWNGVHKTVGQHEFIKLHMKELSLTMQKVHLDEVFLEMVATCFFRNGCH